jgi:hypothetical protein
VRFGVLLVTNVLEESYDSIFRVIVENTWRHISREGNHDVI